MASERMQGNEVTMTNQTPEERADELMKLGYLKSTDPDTIDTLVQALDDPDDKIANAAIWALEMLRPSSDAAVQAVIRTLDHQDEIVRIGAAQTLGKMGSAADVAIPALVACLSQESLGDAAAEALSKIGPISHPWLIRELSATSVEARKNAAFGLVLLGPLDPADVEFLTPALADESVAVRKWVMALLGRYGGAAEEALPDLDGLVRGDPDIYIRACAAEAIWAITDEDPDSLIPVLLECLRDEESCAKAQSTLHSIAESDRSLAERIVRELRDVTGVPADVVERLSARCTNADRVARESPWELETYEKIEIGQNGAPSDYHEFRAHCRNVLKEDPANYMALIALALTSETGSEAYDDVQQAMELNPRSPWVQLRKAIVAQSLAGFAKSNEERQEYGQASVEALEYLISVLPRSREIYEWQLQEVLDLMKKPVETGP